MKKRIAVFANGWNSENLSNFMIGIEKNAKPETMDFFVFLSYASYGYNEMNRKAEALIYELPDLKSFDAIIIFCPGLNFHDVIERIRHLADESGIPVISIGLRHPGHYFIGADNYVGMKALVDHMLEKHDCKRLMFIAGSRENDDSNVRLRAVYNSCKEHDVSFTEKDVFYSNWEAKSAMDYIEANYKSPDEFPDAFLCANDQLALTISQMAEEIYHMDPCKVKIAGFDHLDSSRIYYPSISTVDQEYGTIGKKTVESLNDLFNGIEPEREIMVPCKFVQAESCGCGYSRAAMRERKNFVRQIEIKNRFSANKEGRLFVIEREIFQGQNYDSVKKGLRQLVYENPGYEGNTFYIMLDPILEKIGEKDESLVPRFNLVDEYFVTCGKKDGVPAQDERVNRRDIIPNNSGTGPNSIYLVGMLHYDDLVTGYFVMGTNATDIRDSQFGTYQTRLDRAFLPYIKNLQLNTLNKKLEDLMEQDSLTHVKNRTAYDKYIKSFQKLVGSGDRKEYAVAYFDVNDLKVVNDKYGHEAGDAYIRNSCKLICDTFKHSPVFRIGGDEFLSILYNDDYKNWEELLESMRAEMKLRKTNPEKFSPAARVSIASGVAVYDPSLDEDLLSVVHRADVLMYAEKSKMKNGKVR